MVKRQWIIFNVRQTDQSRMSSIGSPTPLRPDFRYSYGLLKRVRYEFNMSPETEDDDFDHHVENVS